MIFRDSFTYLKSILLNKLKETACYSLNIMFLFSNKIDIYSFIFIKKLMSNRNKLFFL